MPAYAPEKGDFITLSFDPQAGHEQKGRRPTKKKKGALQYLLYSVSE
jgi:hypothetical protein